MRHEGATTPRGTPRSLTRTSASRSITSTPERCRQRPVSTRLPPISRATRRRTSRATTGSSARMRNARCSTASGRSTAPSPSTDSASRSSRSANDACSATVVATPVTSPAPISIRRTGWRCACSPTPSTARHSAWRPRRSSWSTSPVAANPILLQQVPAPSTWRRSAGGSPRCGASTTSPYSAVGSTNSRRPSSIRHSPQRDSTWSTPTRCASPTRSATDRAGKR